MVHGRANTGETSPETKFGKFGENVFGGHKHMHLCPNVAKRLKNE